MPTSKDSCARNAAGTERSTRVSVGNVRKGSRGRGSKGEHGPVITYGKAARGSRHQLTNT